MFWNRWLKQSNIPVNCFPWDYKLRNIQIIASVVVFVYLFTRQQADLNCAAQIGAEVSFINTICLQLPWFEINNHSRSISFEQDFRNFNCLLFLFPNVLLVLFIFLLNTNSHTTKCIHNAIEITKKCGKVSEKKDDETMYDYHVAKREEQRSFASKWFIHAKPVHIFGIPVTMAAFTSIRYLAYVAMFVLINFVSAAAYHPDHYPFQSTVACKYMTSSGTKWTNCVVQRINVIKTALWVMFFLYLVNIFTCLFSCFVVYVSPYFLLRDVRWKIAAYADDPTHAECLNDFQYTHGDWMTTESHISYLLSLVWIHVGDTANWLVVACMDVLKDQQLYMILNDVNKVFALKVLSTSYENSYGNRVYRSIIHDVQRNAERKNGLDGGLKYYINRRNSSEYKIPTRLEQWDKIFSKDYEYSRNIFQLHKLTEVIKNDLLFREIDYPLNRNSLYDKNTYNLNVNENASSNDKIPSSWKRMKNENGTWIERKWDKDHKIMLLAIQGPEENIEAGPTRFFISFDDPLLNKSDQVILPPSQENLMSVEHRVDDWLSNEWKLFSLCGYGRGGGDLALEKYPIGKSIRITMLSNGGEKFYEIQNLKLFGKPVGNGSNVNTRSSTPVYEKTVKEIRI